jgi:hypothetical protein
MKDIRSVIKILGGVRPAAAQMNVPPSTVMDWFRKNNAPRWRHPQLNAALAALVEQENAS